MTTDERLDRLTERHEALAQSLEILTADVHETQSNVKAIAASIKDLLAAAKQDGENIRALARIAEIRERRLTAVEGGDEAV